MENEDMIKEALSYDLESDLHEAWRAPRKKEDGTYEPRMKKSKDEQWNELHGTDDVDIANLAFEDLPSNWQYENLEAAKVAVSLVFDDVVKGHQISSQEIDRLASIIHDEWLKRNDWVFNPEYGDPKLAVSFDQLPEDEKDKDRAQLQPAIEKIQDFLDGKLDIDMICDKYGLGSSERTK